MTIQFYSTLEQQQFEDIIFKRTPAITQEYPPCILEIKNLLNNPSACLPFLKELDLCLQKNLGEHGIDLSPYQNTQGYLKEEKRQYFWPIIHLPKDKISTNRVLHRLLREKEHQHGYNKSENLAYFTAHDNLIYDPVPCFLGFVPPEVGDNIVLQRNIFRDKSGAEVNGIEILHGEDIHRIQWHIIFLYLEEKYHNDLVEIEAFLSQFHAALSLHWGETFDLIGKGWCNAGFCSPFALHSALLLLDNSLPSLSLTLRKTYANKINRLAHQYIGSQELLFQNKLEATLKFGIAKLGSFAKWRDVFALSFAFTSHSKKRQIPLSSLLNVSIQKYCLEEIFIEKPSYAHNCEAYLPESAFAHGNPIKKYNTFFLFYYCDPNGKSLNSLFFRDEKGFDNELRIENWELFFKKFNKLVKLASLQSKIELTVDQVNRLIIQNGPNPLIQRYSSFAVFFKQEEPLSRKKLEAPSIGY